MKKFDAEQKPDTLGWKTTHEGSRALTERELNEAAGGPGPPGTATNGGGLLAWISAEKLI